MVIGLPGGGEQRRRTAPWPAGNSRPVRRRRRWRATAPISRGRSGRRSSRRAPRAARPPAVPGRASSRSRPAAARRSSSTVPTRSVQLAIAGRSRSRTPRHARRASGRPGSGRTRARKPARRARRRRRRRCGERQAWRGTWAIFGQQRGGVRQARAAAASRCGGRRARAPIQGDHLFQRIGRAGAQRVQHPRHSAGNVKKPDPALQECFNRDLVGGIQDRRSAAAGAQGLARQTQRRETLQVGRPKSSRATAARSSRGDGVVDPRRPGQRMRDRDAHVGRAKLRQHAAVAGSRPCRGSPIADAPAPRSVGSAGRTGGPPRSPPGPCSSGWRNRC